MPNTPHAISEGSTLRTFPEGVKNQFPAPLGEDFEVRARIGLVLLSSDQTSEAEFRSFLSVPGVTIHPVRLPSYDRVTLANLKALEKRIPEAAAQLEPGLFMDVVGYGCTSGSIVIGERRVMHLLEAVRPGSRCTTPITSARAAFSVLGMRNIALLTPYRDDINRTIVQYLAAHGIGVRALATFNEEDDRRVCRLRTRVIRDAAVRLGSDPRVDGVFISCTSLRVAHAIAEIEQAIGKPVTSSNHALAWHCLRRSGIRDTLDGFGRLFHS